MNMHDHILSENDWAADLFPVLAAVPDEIVQVDLFRGYPALTSDQRTTSRDKAMKIAAIARRTSRLFSAEKIMTIYKLSTAEGRMIMELAEALLRVPDKTTRDFLIFDKLSPGHWLDGNARGFLKGMTSALALAGGIVSGKQHRGLTAMVSKLGVPTVRRAIETAMRQMGGQFVFAETIERAVKTLKPDASLFSFDMLGEAARSVEDCDRYHAAYEHAINIVGMKASHDEVNKNSGVSIKLSALSCRFQSRYWPSSHLDLMQRLIKLAIMARGYNIPLTIDAEEFGRLKPSLHIFAQLLAHPELRGWDGLGMVVQAYGRHAGAVIDWLEHQAKINQTRISIRLVKGAYWDTEIKLAQEKGLKDFPVYTDKSHTDLAYLAHARRLMEASEYFHPQFASHNAYTLSAVVCLAEHINPISYELQKLHGMGDAVHGEIRKISSAPCRIYAPVGQHEDLLAYLVRRILENGASSSFMNQLADTSVDIAHLINDPYDPREKKSASPQSGTDLFLPERKNSRGFDEDDILTIRNFANSVSSPDLPPKPVDADHHSVMLAFDQSEQSSWKYKTPVERADILNQIADHFEKASARLYHLLVHEAGKTIDDAAGELREAVDFCRYYAAQVLTLDPASNPRGSVVAISPWNFPLAIFTGQIVAALGAGNAVLAKPAEQTPRIAAAAIHLMHQAGVPHDALHLLCGTGASVGQALTTAGRCDMVVFTGSTDTAKVIENAIAQSAKPQAPLIAETGGINAMIVDSSALLERAVDDILTSAFRSAGQRCSALRMLYVQNDIAERLIRMLGEAAATMTVGHAANMDTDIGPVIDATAKARIDQHIDAARQTGRLIWQGDAPEKGCFCSPAMIRLDGIADLASEIFGPVLHIATYKAGEENKVVQAVNASGFGLTFGMHSRIDSNIDMVCNAINVGNVYVNRNQIGAIVGSQPFGGNGLSGTGPKAGGQLYLRAFLQNQGGVDQTLPDIKSSQVMPSPSGERNTYMITPRGHVLVLHADANKRKTLAKLATDAGNTVMEQSDIPEHLHGIDAVMTELDGSIPIGDLRQFMHQSGKAIIPLITDAGGYGWLFHEKHICQDMTASGGNIDLLMQ